MKTSAILWPYCRAAALLVGIGGAMAATLYPLAPNSPPLSPALCGMFFVLAWASVIWAWRQHRPYLRVGLAAVVLALGVGAELTVGMFTLTNLLSQPSRREADRKRHYLALQTAIQTQDLAGVESALRFADIDQILNLPAGWDREMRTSVGNPMEMAVTTDNLSIVAVLFDAGAFACPIDSLGYDPPPRSAQSPMAIAAAHGNVPMLRLLLHHHATVNEGDGNSDALWRAVGTNRADAVAFLLQNGANPNSYGPDNGWTVLDLAHSRGNAAIVHLLLHAGAEERKPFTGAA